MVRIADATRLLDEAEREDRLRMGRLNENEDALLEAVARGRYARIGAAKLRLPMYRSARAGRTRADGRTDNEIRMTMREAVREGLTATPWSQQDDHDRSSDRTALTEGHLDPAAAVRREIERRGKVVRHAEQVLAAVEAAAPASETDDLAWVRRRKRAAAEVEARSRWKRAASDLGAALARLPAPMAREAVLGLLADGGPPAISQRRKRAREMSR